jgi:hypothetical protein
MITLFNIRPRALNVGNDIIAIGLRHLMNEAFGEVVNVISLPATAKYEAHGKAGLDAATIYEINQYGHGVIVGGGNLYENGELSFDANALEALDVPLMLFSLSMGRIYGRLNRLVRRTNAMPDQRVRQLNQRAMVSFARCKATHAHLQGLGIDHAELAACPTLFLDEIADRLPPLPESSRNLVLLSIRNPALMSLPLDIRSRVRSDIHAIAAKIEAAGYGKPRLLCHDYRDVEFAASLKEYEFTYVDDAPTFLSLLHSARLNVTYRLHSALPCLSFGTPCIKISYDERALSLVDTVGYGDWNIDMVKTPDVAAELENRLTRLDELPARRAASRPLWQRLRDINRDGLLRFAHAVRDFHNETKRV